MKNRCSFLCIASALMFLFGLIRGIGGFLELIDNNTFLAAINQNQVLIVSAVLVSILLTSAILISSIGVFEQSKRDVLNAIALIILFVINSLVNAYLLAGNIKNSETTINAIVATIIIALLLLGVRRQRTA
jgi:hypothetical protein